MNYNNSRQQVYLPVIIALSLLAGILIGIYYKGHNKSQDRLFVSGINKSDKINEIINYASQAYVDEVSVDDLTEKAIKGLLEKLDPHSDYIAASEFNEVNDPLQGKFEGIGVQFRIERDTITIINTIAGGPSVKVGLRAGDRIVNIDGKKYVGKKITNDIVMKMLKGKSGTKVKVGILRRGIKNLLDFTITRGVIPTYSIDAAYMVNIDIGYIRLNKFSATTDREFREALLRLEGKGMKKLIIDLRGNGGGYLNSAISVADELLDKDKLIVYTEGKHSPRKEVFSTGKGNFLKSDLVILIDDWSASASEIVAGAIQDNDRGMVIGRRSFGKGLVQEQLKLKDGSAIRLTISRYYTPTGRCIQKPYTDKIEDYYDTFYERFAGNEMEHPDSIHFADSLKYKTPKGKIVYGGGGIMPDIYIAVKKNEYPAFYTKAVNKGLVYKFVFDYVDMNRAGLNKYKTFDNFNKEFTVNSDMIDKFVAFAVKNGIKESADDIKKSGDALKIQLKANIARNLYDDEAFLKVFYPLDNTFTRAVSELEKMKK